MEHPILNYIQKFTILTDEDKKALTAMLDTRIFPKGTVLLREGEVSTDGFFVLKGCVRQYYMVDGEERTTAFFTEEQWLSYSNDPFNPKPSTFSLACVEDTSVVWCNGDSLENSALDPKFETLGRLITEKELGRVQEAFARFVVSSPEERYVELLKSRPTLLNRVPQHQLASYIGVTPESFSRIRKRITEKDRAEKRQTLQSKVS